MSKQINSKRSGFIIAGILALSVLAISATTLRSTDSADFLERHAALVVRDIGHHLLLQSGDFSSRVLPVKRLSKSSFQLEFENKFAFMPDSLVRIVDRQLKSADLPLDYLVNVFECSTNEVVYGFAIGTDRKNIVPCQGRAQPSDCYYIQVSFHDVPVMAGVEKFYPAALITIICSTLIALVVTISKTPVRQSLAETIETIGLGRYYFDPHNRTLTLDSETIELSEKETRLLSLFAANKNQLIDRDHLLKEVWENEGVFTGRSLDMFVSKLRKKLILDSAIRITNIHGRGYKLEIS